MLETIREYGLECLRESGEFGHVQRAHALYYLTLAEGMEPAYWDAQAIANLDTLEPEFENMRTALNWFAESGEIELALRLSTALWWFWYARGHLSEGRQWLELLLSRARGQERLYEQKHSPVSDGSRTRSKTLLAQKPCSARVLESTGNLEISRTALAHCIDWDWLSGQKETIHQRKCLPKKLRLFTTS